MFKQREPSVDALRAFALFGIIVVNLPFFAITYGFAGNAWQDSLPLLPNALAAGVIQGLFESKFILLFSALFGFAALQQFQRYGLLFYTRRLVVLALFGVVNLIFLFEADILLPYAVIGLLLIAVRQRGIRDLLVIAVALWALAVIGMALFGLKVMIDPAPYVAPVIPLAEVLAHGSFVEIMHSRLESWAEFQAYCLWSNYLMVAGAMMAGFAAAKYCEEHGLDALVTQLKRIATFAAIPALVGNTLYAILTSLPVSAEPERFFLMPLIFGPLFAVPLGLVLVAVAMHVFRTPRFARLTSFLAPAGRMSLTIYLGMSLVMGLVFFGYGAALHNQITLLDCLWVAAVIYVAWVVFAQVWFRFVKRGPLENVLSILVRPSSRQRRVVVPKSETV